MTTSLPFEYDGAIGLGKSNYNLNKFVTNYLISAPWYWIILKNFLDNVVPFSKSAMYTLIFLKYLHNKVEKIHHHQYFSISYYNTMKNTQKNLSKNLKIKNKNKNWNLVCWLRLHKKLNLIH